VEILLFHKQSIPQITARIKRNSLFLKGEGHAEALLDQALSASPVRLHRACPRPLARPTEVI
jgi:hypothetical protein